MRQYIPQYVKVGETVKMEITYSEVAMHMRVAGKVMDVKLVSENMAQLLRPDGSDFSFPITSGEAGFYRDERGIYFHPLPQ